MGRKGEGKKTGGEGSRIGTVWGEMAGFVVRDNSLPVAEAASLEMESPPPARHKRVAGLNGFVSSMRAKLG